MRAIVNDAGLRLTHQCWGLSTGTPVILLHGVQGRAALWASVAQALATCGYYVVAPDLRGHGSSDRASEYQLSAHVQDATDLMSALRIAPAHVVGHSLGGTIAWTLAARFPDDVRQLVIEDQHPDPQPAAVAAFEAWAGEWQWRFASRDEALAYLQARGRSGDWWEPSLVELPDGDWGWAFDRSGIVDVVRDVASRGHWPVLERVQAPTLVIRGRESDHLTEEMAVRMAQRIPDARVVTLPGDHWVHRRTELYVAALAHFLAADATSQSARRS